jgi:serine/threonine protein kinase
MNPIEGDALEEQLASALAARDEALAAGIPSTPLPAASEDADLQSRLQANLACLQRLHRLRPLRTGPPSPTDRCTLEELPRSIGRFQIRHELGRGGFGVVFLAHDPVLSRDVALKVPRADALLAPELRARFQQEARAATVLDHPNIVPVFETGEIGPLCYIASAYCPGITLAQWLKEQKQLTPEREAAALVATLAEAVQHAHNRGILHRDLKPANVLLQMENGEFRMENVRCPTFSIPKIADFGLAKLLETDAGIPAAEYATASGTFVGTPNYMAPEQALG